MSLNVTHECISNELQAVEDEICQQLKLICCDDALLEDIYSAFFRGRGKKLRPRLVLLSAFAMCGDTVSSNDAHDQRAALISLAAIVELVHNASLLHDDVLDRAVIRRGAKSINARFGDKIAILAGDILYSKAFEMLLDAADKATTRDLITCVRHMCRGEVANLSCDNFSAYESIIDDKTAALMRFCCKASAQLARRPTDPPDIVDAFETFGHSFGMVYQLADDLSDGDVDASIAAPERIMFRLEHYVARADEALTSVPNSVYKQGLLDLLDFVVCSVERTIGKPVRLSQQPDAACAAANA